MCAAPAVGFQHSRMAADLFHVWLEAACKTEPLRLESTDFAQQDSLDGIAKVIYETKDVKASKTFNALDRLAQPERYARIDRNIQSFHKNQCWQ